MTTRRYCGQQVIIRALYETAENVLSPPVYQADTSILCTILPSVGKGLERYKWKHRRKTVQICFDANDW